MKRLIIALFTVMIVTGCGPHSATNPPSAERPAESSPALPAATDETPGVNSSDTTAAVPIINETPALLSTPDQRSMPQEPGSTAILVYLDDKRLQSTGRELNGTIYLPLAVIYPNEEQPSVTDGIIESGAHGYYLDVRGSTQVMWMDRQEIVPRLVEENGVVWAPISFYRTQSRRVEYDGSTHTITITTLPSPAVRPFPEEIPPEASAFAEKAGVGPRFGVFRPATGNTYWVFAYIGGDYRLVSEANSRTILALKGRTEGSDTVMGMMPAVPWLGVNIHFSPEGLQRERGVFVGEIGWDRVRYADEMAHRVEPVTPRDIPTAVVKRNLFDLGLEEDTPLSEEISCERAWVRHDHAGEAFYVHLVKEAGGWVMVASTWGRDCSNYTVCP